MAQPLKSPGIAAVLGFFFPGIGQIYNGQFGKGIMFIVLDIVNALLTFILIGFVTAPITAIISAIDSYKSAERINNETDTEIAQ